MRRHFEPVARIAVRERYSWSPTLAILMSPVRSASVTSSVTNSVPNFSACLRMLSIRSGPMIPSGQPGKFSTSVVFISAPPAVTPSITSGWRLARAAYTAAV